MPTLVVAALRWSAGPGIDAEDYAQYILHARALKEGRPYLETGYIPSPLNRGQGPRAMPPGVPVVLAGLFTVVGESQAAMKVTMFAFSIAFFLVAGWYFARQENPALGFAVTALVGLSPGVMNYLNHVQSDLPFCLCVWALLLAADAPAPWSWRRATVVALAGLGAMAFRTAAVAIVPAYLLFLALRWKELRGRGLAPVLAWALAIVAGMSVSGMPNLMQHTGWIGLRPLVNSWKANVVTYSIGIGNSLGYPFPWDRANSAYHFIALLLMVVGLVIWVRASRRRLLPIFALVYGAMLMVLPFGEPRYFWVLSPLVLFLMFRGIAAIATRIRPAAAGLVAPSLALILAGCSAARIATSPRPGWFVDRPEARDLFAEMRRLRAAGPLRVAFARPRILALETGIPSTPLFTAEPDTVESQLRSLCISHVIVGSFGVAARPNGAFEAAVTARPQNFTRVYANTEFTVYRFGGLTRDACPALGAVPAPATAR